MGARGGELAGAKRRAGGAIYTGTMNNVEWLRDYHDVVQASRDAPKSLEELQQAANDPKPGYDVHHIVEQTEAERFGFMRSETEHPENLVRIPRLQHYRITGWYMQANDKFDRLSPREYLQDKDWEERYRVGLEALKEVTAIQCSPGNWDVDHYMHGMANGLILAVAIMEDRGPDYLTWPQPDRPAEVPGTAAGGRPLTGRGRCPCAGRRRGHDARRQHGGPAHR